MLQTSTNAYLMEDWVLVAKFVPTPLDHSAAAVTLDILSLDTPATVRHHGMLSVHLYVSCKLVLSEKYEHAIKV